jgi:pyruvate formate lyase activating enzyme
VEAPLVFAVKRDSLDDGPGIRTTVFLKGCPLRCAWCHNPEGQSTGVQFAWDRQRCLGCDSCSGRTRPEECPTGALEQLGRAWGVDELVEFLSRDEAFYRTSGGGVTLSGGEPTLWPEFCGQLLRECHARGWHTLLETCGLFDRERVAGAMLPWLDQVYVDLKLMDDAAHRRYCGASNACILDNVRWLGEQARSGGVPVLVRVPLVPGVTDTDENLSVIADFLRERGFSRVALLPYNPTWGAKAVRLGREPAFEHAGTQGPAELARCRSRFNGFSP